MKTTDAPAPDTRNIHQRLHAVMGEVSYIQKDRDVGKYKVVSHDAVTAKVRPALVKQGVVYYPQNLVYTQDGNRTDARLDIVFVNIDNPTDRISVPTFGYGIDPSDKGPGKAVSYAVKMALLKALGLETGEDADDGTDQSHAPDLTRVKNAPGVMEVRKWVREHLDYLQECDGSDAFIEAVMAVRVRWIRCASGYPNVYQGPDGSGLRGEARKLSVIFGCEPDFMKFIEGVEHEARNMQQVAAQ